MALADNETVARALRALLDRHGYSFQYAVIKRAHELFGARKSPWRMEVVEYPVEVRGTPIHIDFILHNADPTCLLIAECKRANPAFSDWCFAKAPYPNRLRKVIRESITRPRTSAAVVVSADPDAIIYRADSERIYELALEVRSRAGSDPGSDRIKGDPGNGKGTLTKAVEQVIRGMNGLIEHLSTRLQLLLDLLGGADNLGKPLVFIPVVFTTARLWTTDADISLADIQDGVLKERALRASEVPWLYYQYHQSPGIKHALPITSTRPERGDTTLQQVLNTEYARTVAIVGPTGIDPFLTEPPS